MSANDSSRVIPPSSTPSPIKVISPESLKLIAARLAKLKQEAIDGPTVDFIPTAFKTVFGLNYAKPHHHAPLLGALERAFRGERVRFGYSVSPQFGKTELLVGACAQQILRDPRTQIGFGSYVATKAHRESLRTLTIAEHFGVDINKGSRSRGDWLTTSHGGMKAAGLDHGFTGRPFDIMILDDLYDGRKQANSPVHRAAVEQFILETLEVRCRAILLIGTRWHSDDAIGRRLKDKNWEVVNIPAICESEDDPLGRRPGEVHWAGANVLKGIPPELWFKKEQEDAFTWASLYQGRPRPREGSLFGMASYYSSRPDTMRIAVGLDLAYSESSQSDYSVAVVMGREPDTLHKLPDKTEQRTPGNCYVLGVLRLQKKAPEFAKALQVFLQPWRAAPIFMYLAGTELGTVDHMGEQGIRIRPLALKGRDKFLRAQSTAAAWDAGRLLLPQESAWLSDFVDEVTNFTGSGSGHDDQVDALVAAYDALDIAPGVAEVFGQRQMTASMDQFAGGRRGDDMRPSHGILTGGANGAVLPQERPAGGLASPTWRGPGNGF